MLADVTSTVRNSFPDYMGVAREPDARTRREGRRRTARTCAAWAAPSRRVRSGTTAPRGQIAWGDPETGVSFCFLTNGIDEHQLRQWRRGSAIASRAGNCVIA